MNVTSLFLDRTAPRRYEDCVRYPCLFVVALAAGVLPVLGQIPQVDQSQVLGPPPEQQQPPESRSLGELSTGVAPKSPGDPDLGEQVILKRQQKSTPWLFSADTSINYTSNIALADKGARGDTFFLGQLALSYQRKVIENLFFETTVSQGFFKYDRFPAFDFDTLNAGTGLTYFAKGIAFSARYNYNRLTDGAQHDEFFRQHSVTLGAQKTISVNSAFFAYFGATARFNWNEPLVTQRDEYSIYVGGRVALTRTLTFDAFYRAGVFNYNFQSRTDVNQTLALSLRYQPRPWFAVTASSSFGLNLSNRDTFDYKVANTGLTLGVQFKF